ncbi:MAG: hypothetical protein ACX98W_04765 [bacterium]
MKSGRRYRYYVARPRDTNSVGPPTAARPTSSGWRFPAQEIERRVAEGVQGLLESQTALSGAAKAAGIDAERISALLAAAEAWTGPPLDLVQRVDLHPDGLALTVDASRILAGEAATLRHVLPIELRRRGVEMKLVVGASRDESGSSGVDPTLVKAVLRGREWFERLASGRARSYAEIAHQEGMTPPYVAHLVPLAFLAPDIVVSILAGTQPVDLTTETLTNRIDLPLGWDEQRSMLGFDRASK